MQFLLIAYDAQDPQAPERRQQARAAHLASTARQKALGQFIFGGAMLDDAGTMIGSTIIYEFPDRAALDLAVSTDPYVTGQVWQRIQIHPFRAASQPGK